MSYQTMCGIDDAIEYLQGCEPRKKDDDMPQRISERLKYIRDKEVGVKPKYHKGRHITDWWTCGHCGSMTIDSVGDNYCRNCGFRILWDDPRCLTGWREERENERADHE